MTGQEPICLVVVGRRYDLAAVDLQAAIRTLGEITGETTPPDVIDRVFHDFCIGK